MACVKRLDLGLYAKMRHHLAHRCQHARRVGHHVISFGKVHGATIQCADLGQAFGDVLNTLGCADHVRARNRRHRAFGRAKDDVAAHARRQVQDHIGFGFADAFRDLAVQIQATAGCAGFRIADVAMHHRRARLGRCNRAVGDLLRAARHMVAAVLTAARSCDGAGDKHVFAHCKWHSVAPLDRVNMALDALYARWRCRP